MKKEKDKRGETNLRMDRKEEKNRMERNIKID